MPAVQIQHTPTTPAKTTTWEKFEMLVWKNWCIQRNNQRQLLFSVLSPTIFCIILVLLRFGNNTEVKNSKIYELVDIKKSWQALVKEINKRYESVKDNPKFMHNVYVPRLTVAFAPDNIKSFQNIMLEAMKDLDNFKSKGFRTCEQLKASMQTEYYLAGVCFANIGSHTDIINNYQNRLNFSLIFPSELRIYNDTFISFNWNTDHLFDSSYNDIKGVRNSNDGGYVGYIREGFIALQNAVSMAYIRLMTGKKNLPKIYISRFPYDQHLFDDGNKNADEVVPMIMLAGYIYPIMILAKYIIRERERESALALKLMGVPIKMNFGAWFVNGFILLSVSSILLLIFLKIQWFEGNGVLDRSSWFAVFTVMTIYNMYNICFCLMMTAFIRHSSELGVMPLIWLIMYIPYLSTRRYHEIPANYRLLVCVFFPNTAMGFLFENIIHFEDNGRGFTFKSFVNTDTLGEWCSGVFLILLLLMATIFWIIGSYIEEIKSASNKSSKGKCALRNYFQDEPEPMEEVPKTDEEVRAKAYETEQRFKKTTVAVRNVTKAYNRKIVLNNISLKLFEDEITIIIGHNGAGKTVLLKILAGLIRPSKGSVEFYPSGDKLMGVCFSLRYLYKDLTVAEQITLVSRFRGLNAIESEREVIKYTNELGLVNVKDLLILNLKDALLQKLAVACALTGYTKIVLLDDPTSGMDAKACALLWKFLIKEKRRRTILVTTHNYLEAEVIGDRLAILSDGHLKCSGTTLFVRNMYGHGYRLKCYKGPNCNPDDVTKIIQKYVTNETIESYVGEQFTYFLSERHSDFFGPLLEELDTKAEELNLASYAISENSMGGLCIKLGSENMFETNSQKLTATLNGETIFSDVYQDPPFLRKYKPLGKCQLWLNHWSAMFYKQYVYIRQNIGMTIIQMLMPILYICMTFASAYIYFYTSELKPMEYHIQQYKKAVILIHRNSKINAKNKIMHKISEKYVQMLFDMGYEFEETTAISIPSFMLERYKTDDLLPDYHIGVSFLEKIIIAYFNNCPLHMAPLALNLVHNAIVKHLQSKEAEIKLNFEPLPFALKDSVMLMRSPLSFGSMLAIDIIFSISFAWSLAVIFLVRERQTDFKLLQYISGLRAYMFSISTFFFEFIQIVVLASTILFVLIAFHHPTFLKPYIIEAYFVVLIVGGLCIHSINRLLSNFFRDYIDAYIYISAINTLSCVCYYTLLRVYVHGYGEPLVLADGIDWTIRLIPQFSFCNALIKIFTIGELNRICEHENIKLVSIVVEKCKVTPNCCTEYKILSYEYGILRELYFLVACCVVCSIANFAREHQHSWRRRNRPPINLVYRESRDRTSQRNIITEEIINENEKVMKLRKRDYISKPLVCENVGKKLGSTSIFENINFAIERGECFGLHGAEGSGKSMLLEMLVGEEKITEGDVYVDGNNLHTQLNKMYDCIGYSPKHTNLIPEYKISDILKIYGLLHGIPRKQIKETCESLAKVLGFYGHYNKQIRFCSTGNMKRLNWATAFLGNPSMIYMDHPTMAIDEAGILQLWNIIGRLRNNGSTVMLTSVYMQECEDICTRVAFIANGLIKTIGIPWEISKKYNLGYALMIRLQSGVSNRNSSTINSYTNFASFMEHIFPTAKLKDFSGNVVMYTIPSEGNTMATIYSKLQRGPLFLNVEAFCLSRETSYFSS